MIRYVSLAKAPRPRADHYDDRPLLVGQVVIVDECGPQETGLYDASGVKLYRVNEREKVGYV